MNDDEYPGVSDILILRVVSVGVVVGQIRDRRVVTASRPAEGSFLSDPKTLGLIDAVPRT